MSSEVNEIRLDSAFVIHSFPKRKTAPSSTSCRDLVIGADPIEEGSLAPLLQFHIALAAQARLGIQTGGLSWTSKSCIS